MRVCIAGAGKVGRAIARELLSNGHEVLLVDKETEIAHVGVVEGAYVLCADACEVSALEEAQLHTCQVVVAATGDDKVNLVVSLLAKTEFGVPRVVARVNHPKNEWLFNEAWGVDVAVSTPQMLSALGRPSPQPSSVTMPAAAPTTRPMLARVKPCLRIAFMMSNSPECSLPRLLLTRRAALAWGSSRGSCFVWLE